MLVAKKEPGSAFQHTWEGNHDEVEVTSEHGEYLLSHFGHLFYRPEPAVEAEPEKEVAAPELVRKRPSKADADS